MKGLFITFEGIDGCGKSTQARKFHAWLKRGGYPVIFTREPGGTPIAEKIRAIILDTAHMEMAWKTELLLYNAARAQHLEEKILPAVQSGKIVVCDRFYDATVAYQGYGRRLPRTMILEMHRLTAATFKPDRTFILDITLTQAAGRLAETGKTADRMESAGDGFQARVRRGYRTIAKAEPRRCCLIDASGTQAQTQALIRDTFMPLLKRMRKRK